MKMQMNMNPADFDRCVSKGGETRSIKMQGKNMEVCYFEGKAYYKPEKKEEGKMHEKKEGMPDME